MKTKTGIKQPDREYFGHGSCVKTKHIQDGRVLKKDLIVALVVANLN